MMGVEMWFLMAASLVTSLVTSALWFAVAIIGFSRMPRTQPTARLVLLISGLAGGALSLVWPVLQSLVTAVVFRQAGAQSIITYQVVMVLVGTLLWLVPWALLLYGLILAARALTAADER